MRQPASPAESFLAHGLQGIESHHVSARRALGVIQHQDALESRPRPTGPIRQHLGKLLIGLGQVIAGSQSARPHTARFV